jgi:hypothetical protein
VKAENGGKGRVQDTECWRKKKRIRKRRKERNTTRETGMLVKNWKDERLRAKGR